MGAHNNNSVKTAKHKKHGKMIISLHCFSLQEIH